MFTTIINKDNKSYVNQFSNRKDAEEFFEFACEGVRAEYSITLIDNEGTIIKVRA